ncbi:MAG: cobalamin biosynthesis protein CobQ [Tateyamaria sp.]
MAAFLGALAPDLSLYLLAGASLFLMQIPPQVVFDELYFSDAWQTVFAIDNSLVVWGVACGIAVRRASPWAIALTGAAILHICLDLPLHHDDGRPHFWPLTGWVYESPISYWDRAQGARWVAPFEAACAMGAAIVLFQRRVPPWALVAALLLLAAELWIVRQWLFFFGMA